MFGRLGTFFGLTERARLGAAGLHILLGMIVLSVNVAPLDFESPSVLSIELVDAPVLAPEPDDIAPPPLAPVPVEPEPILLDAPVPETERPETTEVPVSSPPAPPVAIAPIIRAAPAPEPDTEEEEETPINPAYIIRRDPFAETAPSASARVAASVMCARTNRETRPAFCPDITDDDLRFAALARAQGDLGGYSPREDSLFAQSTLNRFAGVSSGYEKFRERQQSLDEVASTGASPVRALGIGVDRHPEGLQNCTPVRTGIARVGGGTDGLSTELTNGSEVFCD